MPAAPSHHSRARHAALVVAAWTAFGLLMAQQTALGTLLRGESRTWFQIYAPSMLGAWIWAVYTPLVVPAVRALRRVRERGRHGWAPWLAGHAALALLLAAGDAAVYGPARAAIDGVPTTFARVFVSVLVFDVVIYAVVVALVEAATYAALSRELQGKFDEARLHALESQLRPHFLYNTLNLIAELVHDEPDAADEMLTRLGFLLRRSCEARDHLVPLGDELAMVRAYADIVARRFRDRVTLDVDVPDALHGRLVPVFSLQPLVENAFRHGVERREQGTVLSVHAAERDGRLVLSVRDESAGGGHASASDAPLRDGSGVGLRNTRERLAALFGDAAGLTLDRRDDGAVATLWVPARDGDRADVSHV